VETLLPERTVSFQPTRDFNQGLGLESVDAFPADAIFANDPRHSQHAQMPGNRWAALRKLGGKNIDGRWTNPQPIKNRAPRLIGDRMENISI
jgi:hypothetical protein